MASALILVIAMIAGGAIAAYGLLVDTSGQNIAFSTAGLFILGTALVIAGFLLGSRSIGSGREARTGKALLQAFLGGLFLIAGAGALAGAAVFAIVVLL